MLFLLLGALDLGRVFYANITVSSAAKEAALRASEGHPDGATAAVRESEGGFVVIDARNVTTVYSDSTNQCSDTASFGATVTATVTAPFAAITPYVGAVVGGQTVTLTSAWPRSRPRRARSTGDRGRRAMAPFPEGRVIVWVPGGCETKERRLVQGGV